jgi:hypothetical protein
MRRLIVLSALVLGASQARAEDFTMLSPMAPEYSLLGFAFKPPAGDGWREVGVSPDGVRIVYAEEVGESQINSRADFGAQAFVVEEPDKLPDPGALTRMSMSQRVEEKGKDLVAMSQVQAVDGAQLPMYEYTIVSKVEGNDVFENYFVTVAPDKSQYLAGKLITTDKDFREQPYYAPLRASMGGLRFAAAEKKPVEAPAPAVTPATTMPPAPGTGAGDEKK